MNARKLKPQPLKPTTSSNYERFEELNGLHPLVEQIPESCVLYSVRQLNFGKVAYFNFDLAREMGLISTDHPNRLTKDLEQKILTTFNLRIINEFDQENNILYPGSSIKPHKYMATRYLQLQHPDKKGLSSGDGRCIWNGTVTFEGKTWDVSSRGTGVTCLAPGFVEAGHSLESGNRDFGYGCGLAEIDELYAGALAAEIFYKSGIHTERVLAVIDAGKGMGIGVRAGHNFIRPAHLFLHLKQNNFSTLKKITDYVIERQFTNEAWSFSSRSPKKYSLMKTKLIDSFARFTALLEREYIFAWLDWDGDNVLIDAGIIDYGSIRQFGLRHDQYRYDDVTRFSTNLNQQKGKAKLTIQVFLQLIDFLETGRKKPLAHFKASEHLNEFDQIFEEELLRVFASQIGFSKSQIDQIIANDRKAISVFYTKYLRLEKLKIRRKTRRVADGLNRPPLLNMRRWLALAADQAKIIESETEGVSFDSVLSSFASQADRHFSKNIKNSLCDLQKLYRQLLNNRIKTPADLSEFQLRAREKNRENRITGNALIHITDQILAAKKKGLKDSSIQKAMEHLIARQSQLKSPQTPKKVNDIRELLSHFEHAIAEHKEDI